MTNEGKLSMRKLLTVIAATLALALGTVGTASADPAPPTGGGSNLGGGQSGQCAGPLEDRPASCGN
jgi:hypothetical protein